MIAFIWKLILGGLWKPLLAVLGAAGLYAKGRADAKAKADSRALKANSKTIEEVLRETPSDDPADDIRRRLSDRARKP